MGWPAVQVILSREQLLRVVTLKLQHQSVTQKDRVLVAMLISRPKYGMMPKNLQGILMLLSRDLALRTVSKEIFTDIVIQSPKFKL